MRSAPRIEPPNKIPYTFFARGELQFLTNPEIKSRRVLIIEDNRDLAEVLEHTFQRQGYEVSSTTDGRDAVRLLDLLEPDLVVTDIIMPDADTLDMITALRRSRPRIKIIAISGNPHLVKLAARQGADHALSKPFHLGDLKALVKKLLK